MDQMIIAIDPGREKCGIAVVHPENGVLLQKVINTAQLRNVILELIIEYNTRHIIMGDGTSSKEAKCTLEQINIEGQSITVILIDEHHSTDQARQLYWKKNPPRGLMRLIPVTMRVPPEPVDDYVAVILAKRFFEKTDK